MSLAELARPAAGVPAGVAVAIERLGKSFGQGRRVLDGIDLAIPAGQFLAIVGRSGSGKSTLLRLLGGLDEPSQGRITFDGGPARAGAVRTMFQESRLLPWETVLGNVAVGLEAGIPRKAGQARALDTLRDVGLGERAAEWPGVLSGGQKQRVALARALVSRPGLLLLDEPLGALDALTRLEMQDLLASAWGSQGFTAVLVTHDVGEAVRLADRILLLEDGAVTMDVLNTIPRPRPPSAPDAAALQASILQRLMAG